MRRTALLMTLLVAVVGCDGEERAVESSTEPQTALAPVTTLGPVTTAAPGTTVEEIPISPTTTIAPAPLGEDYWLYGDDEPGALGGVIGDVAVADDGTVWAVVLDVDYQGPLLDGMLWDLDLESAPWALMRHDGTGWAVVANSEESPLPSWHLGPRLLGVRPDGGVWFHDHPVAPEGPSFLWEYRDGTWVDHTATAHLPGDSEIHVSMGCCPMGIDAAGAVWVGSESGSTGSPWDDDGPTWISRFDGVWQTMEFPTPMVVGGFASIWMPAEVVLVDPGGGWDIEGIERGGVRWTLERERSEPGASDPRTWEYQDGLWVESGLWVARDSGIWERRAAGMATESFPVDIGELEANLGCNLTWGVFNLETESVIAPDGALWTAWPCIGLTRVDPLDGSMNVFGEGAFHGVWRLAVAPNGTVYAGGTQGLVAFSPSPDVGVPIGNEDPGDQEP